MTESLQDPERALAESLRAWHADAGAPSVRRIAEQVSAAEGTTVSHTTVADALRGTRIPSWPRLSAIVQVIEGDLAVAKTLWIAAHNSRRTAPRSPADAETAVVRMVTAALELLEPAARSRILAYVNDFFGGEAARENCRDTSPAGTHSTGERNR